MTIAFYILAGYVIWGLIILINIKTPKSTNHKYPSVTVIVAARDEENNIAACVKSLIKLEYPTDKLDIVIVDDNSTDNTANLIREKIEGVSNCSCYCIKTADKNFPGKAGAIDIGVTNSRGDILFFTDADCVVKPSWIHSLLSHFLPNTGIVGGFTLYEHPDQHQTFLVKNLSTEVSFVSGIALACASLNQPASWMGNNMAIRREAYEQADGMAGLNNYLVEDFELIRAVKAKTDFIISFTPNPDAQVYSKANENLTDFYRQRKRWGSALKNISPFIMMLMGLSILVHGFIIYKFFANIQIGLLAYFVKVGIDSLILWKINLSIKRKTIWVNFIGFQFFYILQLLIFPILFIFDRKVIWKGITYNGQDR